jgi:hypothetical protein
MQKQRCWRPVQKLVLRKEAAELAGRVDQVKSVRRLLQPDNRPDSASIPVLVWVVDCQAGVFREQARSEGIPEAAFMVGTDRRPVLEAGTVVDRGLDIRRAWLAAVEWRAWAVCHLA